VNSPILIFQLDGRSATCGGTHQGMIHNSVIADSVTQEKHRKVFSLFCTIVN